MAREFGELLMARERYLYADLTGTVVGCVDRIDAIDSQDGKKRFVQQRCENGAFVPGLNGVKLPLYRLLEVRERIDEPIYFAEGERKTDCLANALRCVESQGAVTTIAGGGNEILTAEHLAQLRGCVSVVVLADSDVPGRLTARTRARAIVETYPKASVRIVDFYPDLHDGRDVGDFLNEGRTFDEFLEIVAAAPVVQPDLEEIEQLSAAYDDRLIAMGMRNASQVPVEHEDDQRRYTFGINNIDQLLGPLRPGEVTIIAARQGEGKTALALKIARTNAVKYTVAVATLEMTSEDLRDRLLSSIMYQDLDRVEMARLHSASIYHDAVRELARLNLFLWEPKPDSALGVADKSLRAITASAEAVSADLLIIDWTRCISGWKPGDAGGASSAIVEQLVQYARVTRIHIILVSQLNRDAQGKRPMVSQLQDTGALEQLTHKVVLLWQPFSEETTNDIMEVIGAKNRRGRKFRSHVHLLGSIGEFASLSRDDEARRATCCKPKEYSKNNVQAIDSEPRPKREKKAISKEDQELEAFPF
jgi:hypothetical protein